MEHREAVIECSTGCDHEALLAALAKRGYGGEIRVSAVHAAPEATSTTP